MHQNYSLFHHILFIHIIIFIVPYTAADILSHVNLGATLEPISLIANSQSYCSVTFTLEYIQVPQTLDLPKVAFCIPEISYTPNTETERMGLKLASDICDKYTELNEVYTDTKPINYQ